MPPVSETWQTLNGGGGGSAGSGGSVATTPGASKYDGPVVAGVQPASTMPTATRRARVACSLTFILFLLHFSCSDFGKVVQFNATYAHDHPFPSMT